jgi:sulfite reductase (NADPH) flavoprotein alpha-component
MSAPISTTTPMVPVLPESSPFSSEQRNWLNGFLAGLSNTQSLGGFSAQQGGSSASGPSAASVAPALPVLILFGSQSGTAEGLAQALSEKLAAYAGAGANGTGPRLNPRVVGMDRFREVEWASEARILLLSSTWGDGDMPDNAVAFWDWLKGADAPSMAHAGYAVLGLGDRNYAKFCQAGRNLDGRFAELGAKRLVPLCECDTDYESKSEQWMDAALSALEALLPGTSALPSDSTPEPSPVKTGSAPAYSRKNPFPAPLIENHPLNAKGSGKDTRHLAISLLGSGLEYKVGDALGVFPRNCYELVDRIILSLNCLGNEKVTLDGGEEMALRAALISRLDLRRGSERLLHNIRQACMNQGEKRRLDDLLAEDGIKARPYLADRDVLDVLLDFPHTRLDAQHLAASLSKIAPRLYSISSSPKENPGEVHLTVGVVRYSVAGRRRLGVASSFLAERVPLGMTVPVFVQPTAHFTLPPESGKPIIMVGPGTGVAPFRAFLQERRFLGDAGRNWLFFGDQRRQYDFLYSEEFVAMEASGFLTRMDLAFSRDQDEKVYVQTRMLEQSRELFAWLEAGAHFYVCGDAKRMAKDVEEALLQIIAKESGKGSDTASKDAAARAYLDKMKEQKRYQRDVY